MIAKKQNVVFKSEEKRPKFTHKYTKIDFFPRGRLYEIQDVKVAYQAKHSGATPSLNIEITYKNNLKKSLEK